MLQNISQKGDGQYFFNVYLFHLIAASKFWLLFGPCSNWNKRTGKNAIDKVRQRIQDVSLS